MAITLNELSIRAKPKQIPPHGGTATVLFEVSMSSTRRQIECTLALRPPYSFAEGGQEHTRTFDSRSPERDAFATYDMPVEIVKTGTGDKELILVSLLVQEMSKGKPKGTARKGGCEIRIREATERERTSHAKELKELREAKGVTQAELEKKTGLSRSTISRAERGIAVSEESRATIHKTLNKLK